jgi:hypothetical protein
MGLSPGLCVSREFRDARLAGGGDEVSKVSHGPKLERYADSGA